MTVEDVQMIMELGEYPNQIAFFGSCGKTMEGVDKGWDWLDIYQWINIIVTDVKYSLAVCLSADQTIHLLKFETGR